MVANANWLSRLPHKQLIMGSTPIATSKHKYLVMKILSILAEQTTVTHFYGDYSHGYGVQNFDGMPVDSSFDEEVEFAQDEYGIENGRIVAPGTWVGWSFDDPEYDEAEDELLMSGNVCVITSKKMDEDDPFFRKVFAAVEQDADRFTGQTEMAVG